MENKLKEGKDPGIGLPLPILNRDVAAVVEGTCVLLDMLVVDTAEAIEPMPPAQKMEGVLFISR